MTIYQRMAEVFRVADLPGFLSEWRKTPEYPAIPPLYAAYAVNRRAPAQSADDAAIFTRYEVSINVYGVEDVSAAVETLEDALTLEGFDIPEGFDVAPRAASQHIYVERIEAVYIDFGAYGPAE